MGRNRVRARKRTARRAVPTCLFSEPKELGHCSFSGCWRLEVGGSPGWYPHPELNGDQRFRKPPLYPFELWGRNRPENLTPSSGECKKHGARTFPSTAICHNSRSLKVNCPNSGSQQGENAADKGTHILSRCAARTCGIIDQIMLRTKRFRAK